MLISLVDCSCCTDENINDFYCGLTESLLLTFNSFPKWTISFHIPWNIPFTLLTTSIFATWWDLILLIVTRELCSSCLALKIFLRNEVKHCNDWIILLLIRELITECHILVIQLKQMVKQGASFLIFLKTRELISKPNTLDKRLMKVSNHSVPLRNTFTIDST